MTAASPAAVTGEFRIVQRIALARSPLNPRKSFDESALAELATSIKKQGIAQPIVVRPMPGATARQLEGDGLLVGHPIFEIVAGERRWRAAQMAGLDEVPVMIRKLADKDALELMTIENAQREDLHPLELAAHYERLIDDFGYSPESIGDAIGKSRAHVFQIRKLKNLAPDLRKRFAAGEMDTTLATVFARVPGEKLQLEAWQRLKGEYPDGCSFRVAADFVRTNYMLDLGRAPFNIKDATLVPKAGSCTACPKRTGTLPDLFPDVKSGNVCTDPVCFQTKRAAAQAREVKTLEAKGTEVIAGAQAKTILPHEHSRLNSHNGFAPPAEKCWDDAKRRSYGELAKLAGVDRLKIQNPHTGGMLDAIPVKKVNDALKKKGIALRAVSVSRNSDHEAWRARQKATERKVRLENQARRLILEAIRKNVRKHDLIAPPVLQILVASYWRHIWHEYRKKLADLWGWKEGPHSSVVAKIKGLDAATLARMVVDCALVDALNAGGYHDGGLAKLTAASRRWRVQDGKIRAGVFKADKLKRDAKAAAAKKRARKAPSKVKTIKAKGKQK